MSVLKYHIELLVDDKRVGVSVPIYVKFNDVSKQETFSLDVNYCGPNPRLEKVLMDRVKEYGVKMARAIDAPDNTFDGILSYSLPIELWSSEPVDMEANYEH